MSETLIEIRDLKTYFFLERGTVKAVDGVDLTINKGETVGLVGESGCGKSTLALSILRLVPDPPGKIVGGEILFEGEDLLKKPMDEMRKIRGKKISMIFQDPTSSLNPVFNIGDQVSEGVILHEGLNKKEGLNKAIGLLKDVGIPSAEKRVDEYPHQFSGGMRQRVMIAMALSCNPDLLIADEPTTNLDATIQTQILDLMIELKKKYGSSVLMVTHHLGIVAEMCEKVAVMYAGDIVEYADVVKLFYESQHPYTYALLRCIPRGPHHEKRLLPIEGTVPDLIKPPSGCKFHPRCPKAFDRCRIEKPKLISIGPDHKVACHLFSEA